MIRLLLLALLFCPASARALTLDQLRVESRRLAIDNGARLRFSTSTIDGWLNEAHRIAAVETRAIRKPSAFELVAGTTYYSLPSDFLKLARLTFKHRELGEETPESLAGKIGWNWFEAKGQPTSYYINFATRTMVAFYPWPDTSSSTGTIRYEYWAQSTDMSATSDQPWGSITELVPHHRILAYFAAAHMCAIDGRPDLSSFYLGLFSTGLERMRKEANDRPSYRPSMRPGVPSNRTGP